MSIKKINWPKHPKIFEINTWPWLKQLSEKYNFSITLELIPEEVINSELKYFDAIWLMGVWERSPKGKKIAIEHPDLQNDYKQALRYFNTEDIVGSPYSVFYYHVDKHLGGKNALGNFRRKLKLNNLRLILDYIPNHVAIDHIWTLEKGDLFVEGTLKDQMTYPYGFFNVGNKVYAHGRDPYFPPWTDTVQINAFSCEARKKAINTLLNIAEQCDGVRCDMAMLLMNDVFKKTWGDRVGEPLEREFWVEVISAIKNKFPEFIFIAEVYWDLEWNLQQQGFDYCYDKRLYDRLIHDNSESIKAHLKADLSYQNKLVRFIENHDERRAIEVFGEEKLQAAAIIFMTLPGAHLIHEGQMLGYKIKLPVQLGRRESESINQKIKILYENLLKINSEQNSEKSNWSLCKIYPIGHDQSYRNLISYIWITESMLQLIVVNYSQYLTQGHIKIDGLDYGSYEWVFKDLLTEKNYIYNGKDLNTYGLYVDLDAWKGHIFEIAKSKEAFSN